MSMLLSFELDDDLADALRKMIAGFDPGCTPEIAAAAVLYDRMITAGYLPDEPIEEDIPTQGKG
jgi:hypothetical protein